MAEKKSLSKLAKRNAEKRNPGTHEYAWIVRMNSNPYAPGTHHWYAFRFLCHAARDFATNLDDGEQINSPELWEIRKEYIRYHANVLVGIDQMLVKLKSVMEVDPTIKSNKLTLKAVRNAKRLSRPDTHHS